MTTYQEIRAAGKTMSQKCLEATRHLDYQPGPIAKRMTLPTAGKTLIFQDEVAQNAFFDFWFAEYRLNGRTLVDSVDPVQAGLQPWELEVLEAYRRSRSAFLQTVELLPREPRIRMRDLLDPDQPEVWLTEMGLSDSMRRLGLRLALFCRLLTVRDITMTSGFSFGFPPQYAPGIVQACRQKMKRVPPEDLSEARFVFFFQQHRQKGVEQEYRDVV
ncbi:MAG: hypothetical protein MUE94_10850 [Verrucomicrobia bacterium]|jgi:hypothetical protein|nr:hypothetical protein [Verrucomicrobiota bacterium]